MMNWVDLVLVAYVAWSGYHGSRQGALRQVGHLVGLVVGFIIGSGVAGPISGAMTHALWRPVVALLIVLVIAIVVGHLGEMLGRFAAKALHELHLGVADVAAGAAVGIVTALVVSWFFAGIVGSVAWGSLAGQIQTSRILTALNAVMPPVPASEAKVRALFESVDLPGIFASIVAPSVTNYHGPTVFEAPQAGLTGPRDVVKVLASGGCAKLLEGTAFFVAPHTVVTNAHVIAGEHDITVDGRAAQVALYDPHNDLAVLVVPSLTEAPLRFASSRPAPLSPVQIVGFPLDGSRTRTFGAVEGEITGPARDIYQGPTFLNTMIALRLDVQPGNSGSPVLDDGLVVGVVDSRSLSQPSTGYAIPGAVVTRDLARVNPRGDVSTMACVG
jgi:S1-C subfamily serine protease